MAKKKAAEEESKKIARQDELPGMEDRGIKSISEAALDYKEILDQRLALTPQEVELKTKLIDLMHAHKKTEYKYGNVSIKLTVSKEKIKVKVKGEDDGESETGE